MMESRTAPTASPAATADAPTPTNGPTLQPGETVLVTGARAPVALELCRSFADAGHRVIAADSCRFPLSRFSRSVAAFVHLPSPVHEPEGFRTALTRSIKRSGARHLVPTCEEIFHIARIADLLPCHTWSPSLETLVRLHHKQRGLEWIADHLAVPATRPFSGDPSAFEQENKVFKRAYTRFGTEVVVGSPNPVQRQKILSEPEAWLVQDRVEGTEICVTSVWQHGRLRGYATYRPAVRFGPGAGIVFQPVENPPLQQQVTAFGESIGMHGLLSFDVIVKADGSPVVIECNPRATSGLHLLGRELHRCFTADANAPRTESLVTGAPEARAVKTALYTAKPTSMFNPQLRRLDDVIFERADPLPFFCQGLSLLEWSARSLKHRCSFLRATTIDIEWNQDV